MIIAITGSNGFIAQHIKNMLINLGYDVISISRKLNNQKKSNTYTYEELYLGKIRSHIDCFIHLASPNYDFAKDNSLEVGISKLTESILSSLNQYRCKKIIYFSSAKVYGEPSIQNNSFDELTELSPITDYGKEKQKAENIIKTFSRSNDLDYLIYRLPMVYGKNMNSNISKLLNIIDRSLPFPYFRDTNYLKKSFLSIDNIKKIIQYNIENPESINKDIFNLSDYKPLSINELVKSYRDLSRSKSIFIALPYSFFKILTKTPIFNKILVKLYGSFLIENKKFLSLKNVKINTTQDDIKSLLKYSK